MPRPAPQLLPALVLLAFLIIFVQLQLLAIILLKLGLPPGGAYLLLFASLLGSLINLPLFRLQNPSAIPQFHPGKTPYLHFPGFPPQRFRSYTVVAVNVGGCLVPLLFAGYLLVTIPVPWSDTVLATLFVVVVSFLTSRPVHGLGIGMPILIAPLAAALSAFLLNPQLAAPLAYVSATLGVLFGADLLRLKDIGKLDVPFAAIGGAGTFDGIFISGIVAVLLV